MAARKSKAGKTGAAKSKAPKVTKAKAPTAKARKEPRQRDQVILCEDINRLACW